MSNSRSEFTLELLVFCGVTGVCKLYALGWALFCCRLRHCECVGVVSFERAMEFLQWGLDTEIVAGPKMPRLGSTFCRPSSHLGTNNKSK